MITHPGTDGTLVECDVCKRRLTVIEGNEEPILTQASREGWTEALKTLGGFFNRLSHYCPDHAEAYTYFDSGLTAEEAREHLLNRSMALTEAEIKQPVAR